MASRRAIARRLEPTHPAYPIIASAFREQFPGPTYGTAHRAAGSQADVDGGDACLGLDFYQTLDLYGDEFAQPIGAFKSLFRLAKDAGLRVKAHVGEWGTADDVWRASNSWNSPRRSTELPRPPRRQ